MVYIICGILVGILWWDIEQTYKYNKNIKS